MWGGRGGSRNSLTGGGGGVLGQNSSKGGFRVQVRGNFHILTSTNKKKPLKGGGGGLTPPSGSATGWKHSTVLSFPFSLYDYLHIKAIVKELRLGLIMPPILQQHILILYRFFLRSLRNNHHSTLWTE